MAETMLIVDDFDLERDMLHDLLQDSFSIIEAHNGKECLDIICDSKIKIDVVVLDLMMPVMDGFEVLERRKNIKKFRDIPVIVLTSSDELQDQVRSFNLGATDFITKPIISGLAISRIKNTIASKLRNLEQQEDGQIYRLESEYDLMTGLYNIKAVEKRICVELMEHPDRMHALLIIDIDDFKNVNNQYGRCHGDNTLRKAADFLLSFFRKADIVGRIAADKFIIFMTGIANKDVVRLKAKDIVRKMKYNQDVDMTLSIGLAYSDYEGCTYESLLARAGEALTIAKQTGKCKMSEYGVQEEMYKKDDRKKIIVLSENKMLCSMVDSVAADNYAMRQLMSVDEYIAYVSNSKVNLNDIIKYIIDVSDFDADTSVIWEKLKRCVPSSGAAVNGRPGRVIAICKEGDMEQYRQAVLSEIPSDIISAPVNMDQLKRRIIDTLETGS